MENKADIKSIMARFQSVGASVDEASSAPAGRPKQPLHPTLSGPTMQKKPVLESLSGSAINGPMKPNFLKNSPSTKSDTEAHEPNKAKALASRFGNAQDDANTTKPFTANKHQVPLKSPFALTTEAKGPIQKPPFNKPPLSSSLSESKPAFPKPSAVAASKPSWVKEDSGGGPGINSSPIPPKVPSLQQKPSSSLLKLRQHNEDPAPPNTDTESKPSPPVNAAFKPVSNFKSAQNMFSKNKDASEQTDSGAANKAPLAANNSLPPPKPPTSKKPSVKKPSHTSAMASSINGDATSTPKRNPLPNSLALGAAPAKPNRPPVVNLENFKRTRGTSEDGPSSKKSNNPPPLTSHPPNQSSPQPPQTVLPSLPPRHPGTMNQQEDFYDDVDEFSSPPPPPGHPSQRAKDENDDDDDGDMYEPLDDRWEASEKTQDKKKDEKEEKKRLDAEKKEQKEREKKENDARKKFKLVGALEVLQRGKALTDCKSSKSDLALKQGESLDIIRIQGNPEGKWLGRTQDGSIGYVKTTLVEIDFNSLKNRQSQTTYEPEVYDDIDVLLSENSSSKGPGVVLPPLPGEGGEIYDDVVDPNLEVRVPPPSQFTADGNSDQPGVQADDEIYDDVDSQTAPPLPPISSLPGMKAKNKTEDMDPKKQKKFEKEEKEFRKKFKYEGEIQVLYQVSIVPMLNNKKWTWKDLPLKGGEQLDVIVKPEDDKLICRNEDGKFGCVSTSHIVNDDGEIYDDIGGDECIYDND
ncbi:FYN-binding protein 1 isoform X2 [Cololabis saira]|uniref:FYN-binding protein 1 isoform X2 n=1 Tax=Cololabis saira TaxID=129043 RepID=UPI002AD3D410|nr:FYN-binding protein 1 isoform X2 [Cololabis saira]